MIHCLYILQLITVCLINIYYVLGYNLFLLLRIVRSSLSVLIFRCGVPVFQTPLIKETILLQLYILSAFVKTD